MDIRLRPFKIASCVAQVSKDPTDDLIEPTTESKQCDYEEIKMTTTDSINNKPVLYWVTLAIMFAGFFAVVMS